MTIVWGGVRRHFNRKSDIFGVFRSSKQKGRHIMGPGSSAAKDGIGTDAGEPQLPRRALGMSGQQRALHLALSEKSVDLAGMYLGAVTVLGQLDNSERFVHAAHSLRELMDKVPDFWDVPVKALRQKLSNKVTELRQKWCGALKNTKCCLKTQWDGPIDKPLRAFLEKLAKFFEWFTRHQPARKDETRRILRAIDASSRCLPGPLESWNVKKWHVLRGYFVDVCHHGQRAQEDEFHAYLNELERFLLDLICPRTFDDFSRIDAIIAEGEERD